MTAAANTVTVEEGLRLMAAGRSKYGAKRCTLHTPAHASQKECRRFLELEIMERIGRIRHLRQQVRHILLPRIAVPGNKVVRAVAYVSDFEYEQYSKEWLDNWRWVIEDVKGVRTPTYRLKARLMMGHRCGRNGCKLPALGDGGVSYVTET